jgi:glycosyltransferase involved in cell wall biosynthesis
MRHGDAWDIVHAVTPVSPIASTRLYQLGLPVVLGPWNGGLKSPKAFPEIMKSDSSWFYSIRNLGKALDCLRGGSSNAAAILTANQATRDSLPAGARSHCVDMLENGVDLKRFVPTEWPYMPGKAGPLRIVFVGRLVPFKGVAMLLNAVARLQGEIPLEVRVVGGGPMAQEWSDLTAQLALSKVVQFCGPVALSEIPQHLNWAHVFCLPSVRESGGAVLLEAMACARPVIAINYGGPATVADDTVGRLLPADGEESVIGGLMETIRDIWGHPAAWQEKGAEGRRRAHDRYEWSAKIARVLELYQQLPKSL